MSPASQVSFTFQIDGKRREKRGGEDRLTVKLLLVLRRSRDELVAYDGDDGVLLLGFLAIQHKLAFTSIYTRKRTKEEGNVLNNRLSLRCRVTTVGVLGDSRRGGLVLVELLLDGTEETHFDFD